MTLSRHAIWIKVRFRITQRDIDKGCQASAHSCPVARAIDRRLRYPYEAWIGGCCVDLYHTNALTSCSCELPVRIQRWIEDFDNGKSTKPTSFTMRIPVSILERN